MMQALMQAHSTRAAAVTHPLPPAAVVQAIVIRVARRRVEEAVALSSNQAEVMNLLDSFLPFAQGDWLMHWCVNVDG